MLGATDRDHNSFHLLVPVTQIQVPVGRREGIIPIKAQRLSTFLEEFGSMELVNYPFYFLMFNT
jgi:hypothetical protein